MEPHTAGQLPLDLVSEHVDGMVQRATLQHTAQVVRWHLTPLTGGRELISGLYRVDVDVRLRSRRQPRRLSLVLKLVRMTPERCAPAHWNYWLREAHAYASGSLAVLPPGLAAPACYGVVQSGDVVAIWLEDLGRLPAAPWTEADIGAICFRLGRFNGAYLTDTELPTGTWATAVWLRQYVTATVSAIEHLPQLQQHPLLARAVAPPLVPDLLHLVEERERWLELLQRVPQVFCHQDVHHANLFRTHTSAGDLRFIAIDWSFSGSAAVGQELASVLFTNRHVPNVYTLATQQYRAGLRAAGWHGDETLVLWTSAITAALNYGIAMVGLFLGQLVDEQQHAGLVDGFGVPIADLAPRANRWVQFGLEYARLARSYAPVG